MIMFQNKNGIFRFIVVLFFFGALIAWVAYPHTPETPRAENDAAGNTAADPSDAQTMEAVELYRYFNISTGDHLYTTAWDELKEGTAEYTYQGVQCYVYLSRIPGTVPLHRYYNADNGDHFYTTSRDEHGSEDYGYAYERIQGYVYERQKPGTIPLHRYYNETTGDHFYTTDWNEAGREIQGYVYEGVQCYVNGTRHREPPDE